MKFTKIVFIIALVAATQARAFVMDVNSAGQRQRWNLLTPVPGLSTNVVNGTLVKVSGWYDNEWGYSSRCVDLLRFVGAIFVRDEQPIV